ncbi:hypothetical protein TNCV_4190481 [Trichonephila clavipes]|nr:hypothetical protein TNCV_4190481 [Trichonephila clavipes]
MKPVCSFSIIPYNSTLCLSLIYLAKNSLDSLLTHLLGGRGSLGVKVTDSWQPVMSSSLVPLKTCREGERCTLNLLRAETSSHWCGVEARGGSASSSVVLVT